MQASADTVLSSGRPSQIVSTFFRLPLLSKTKSFAATVVSLLVIYPSVSAAYLQICRPWIRSGALSDLLMSLIRVPTSLALHKSISLSIYPHILVMIFRALNLGLICDLLWSDPDKDTETWGENDRGVSFTFGPEIVQRFLHRHDLDLICRAHQVGSSLLSFLIIPGCRGWLRILCKAAAGDNLLGPQLLRCVIVASSLMAGEFDNAAAMMSVTKELNCSFQVPAACSLFALHVLPMSIAFY
jgi:hypothetical protein